ncbi:OmpA family protein [Serratia marcescens]|nr:OmpA family protein [Serratia marcescens]
MGWQAKTKNAGRTAHDAGISPLAALGTELAFNDDWAMRLEYQYVSNIGEGGDSGITVDNGQTSLGLIYHFGATVRPEPQPVQAAAPPVARPVTQTFNLRSDVLFAHNSAVLMPAGHEAVVKLYRALQQQASTTGHILVKGYTDRTGRPDYNQALSTRRAQAVADALIEQGISAAAIAVQGEGSQAPVTGSNCDAVKARGALIDCLAPDRRVEVEVTGEKPASASVATPATVPVVDPALEMHF